MASTNKTTNYQLSQYIGSDKPTYLGDYNSDMSKIDTQMKTNADNIATAIAGVESATSTANSAVATATQANTTAQNASSVATSASTTASNAQSTANSALSTATSAQSKSNEVETNLNNFESKLNFTHFDSYPIADITVPSGTKESGTLTVASNDDGSVAKIYGQISINGGNQGSSFSFRTRLRPKSNITINGMCIVACKNTSNALQTMNQSPVTIATDGTVTVPYNTVGGQSRYFLIPCVLFLKDFGDTPTPTPNE